MKTYFKAICAILLFISCGTSKKIKESTTIKKTTIEHEVLIKDSIVDVKKTKIIEKDSIVKKETILPSENEIELDLEDLANMEGDFKSTVKSGGNETTIEKKGSIIKITTKSSGSESVETKVTKNEINESEKETTVKEENNNTKIEETETTKEKFKRVYRIPWWLYLIASAILTFVFKKQILNILAKFFPALKLNRLFLLLLGKSKN